MKCLHQLFGQQMALEGSNYAVNMTLWRLDAISNLGEQNQLLFTISERCLHLDKVAKLVSTVKKLSVLRSWFQKIAMET